MLLYISETPDLYQSPAVFLIIGNQWKYIILKNLHITHIHRNKLKKANRNLSQNVWWYYKGAYAEEWRVRQCLCIFSPIGFLHYMHRDAETTASVAAPLRKTKKMPCLLVLVTLSFWTDMRDGDLLCEHPTPFSFWEVLLCGSGWPHTHCNPPAS